MRRINGEWPEEIQLFLFQKLFFQRVLVMIPTGLGMKRELAQRNVLGGSIVGFVLLDIDGGLLIECV
jgi:hypothetical protein